MSKGTIDQYRNSAKKHFHSDGEIEIDDKAAVSKGDDEGAYVQAWIWVPDDLLDS